MTTKRELLDALQAACELAAVSRQSRQAAGEAGTDARSVAHQSYAIRIGRSRSIQTTGASAEGHIRETEVSVSWAHRSRQHAQLEDYATALDWEQDLRVAIERAEDIDGSLYSVEDEEIRQEGDQFKGVLRYVARHIVPLTSE